MDDDIMIPTHKGLFLGIVPVYLDMTIEEAPIVAGRFIGCEMAISIVSAIFGVMSSIATFVNPEFEPSFAFVITGKVSGIEIKR